MIYLDHLQRITEHQQSLYKYMDVLLNTLKFVHKIYVGIIKFVSSSAELVLEDVEAIVLQVLTMVLELI